MDKAEQIEALKKFQASIPAGNYLHDMLNYLVPQFESDTRVDYPCVPDLRVIENQVRDAQEKFSKVAEAVRDAEQRLAKLDLAVRVRKAELSKLAESAERIAHLANVAA